MSLRLRLTLGLGAAFVLLWSLAATWMLYDLRSQLLQSLDERLAASARMVAGLLVQLPQARTSQDGSTRLSAEQLGIPNGLACQISSLRGEVLARSHSTPENMLDASQQGFHDQVIGDQLWRSFTLIQDDLRITTADRLDERATLQRSILLAAAVPVAVALLGSLALLWVGLGRGLAPLERIRAALAGRSANASEPLPLTDLPAELAPLVEAQNQLFQRIGATLERERRLTDDAAHELRSPLTAVKTHLQVAAMTEGEPARIAIAMAEQGADHLQRILEQLLMLARVEGNLPFDEGLPCRPLEIAQQAIADATYKPGAAIELSVADDLSEQCLAMPPALAIAALRNLLENARRHTRPGTQVDLHIARDGQGRVRFSIRDQGPGIPPSACNASPSASGAAPTATAAAWACPSSRPSPNAAAAACSSSPTPMAWRCASRPGCATKAAERRAPTCVAWRAPWARRSADRPASSASDSALSGPSSRPGRYWPRSWPGPGSPAPAGAPATAGAT